MIEVIDRTRRGWSSAIVCTIIPPMDTPAMWALSHPRWSIRPKASAARSFSVYGGRRTAADERLDQLAPVDPALGPAGASGVAVVVADDVESGLGEHGAQLGVPPRHRPTEPHHQHERLAVGAAEGLVAELDSGRDRGEQLLGDGYGHVWALFSLLLIFCEIRLVTAR